MLIWNETAEELCIRIKGNEKTRIVAQDFPPPETIEENEISLKAKIDEQTVSLGYHCYIHIFDKAKKTRDYVVWFGPIGSEPQPRPGKTYWWESRS